MELPDLKFADGLIGLVLLVSTLRGLRRGMVREVVSLSSWVAAFVAGFVFGPSVIPLMPEIGILGDYADSCLIGAFLAYGSVFLLTLLCFSLLAPFASQVSTGSFGPVDVFFGLLFGFARAVVLVVGAYMLYGIVVAESTVPDMLRDAWAFDLLDSTSEWLRRSAAEQVPSRLGERIEALTAECRSPLGGIQVPR